MGMITGGEARELYPANPVILLPMGSHEDQGPHAPMGDYLLAEKIAELAAVKATAAGTRTVVAPVLPFGGADFFGPMIGGIAITPPTLTAVITDMVASLHRTGLTRIIVINGHGGNVGPIAEVARALYREKKLLLPSLYLWRIAYGLMPGLFGADLAAKVAGHGADPLTSLGLHLLPEILRPDMIPAATPLKRDPRAGPCLHRARHRELRGRGGRHAARIRRRLHRGGRQGRSAPVERRDRPRPLGEARRHHGALHRTLRVENSGEPQLT